MNYLQEILAMNVVAEINGLSPSEFRLWHCLMSIANSLGWREQFTVANTTLSAKTHMPVRTLQNARNKLIQRGYVTVTTRGNGKAPEYQIHTLTPVAVPVADVVAVPVAVPPAVPVADVVAVPVATLNKQTNKTNKQNKLTPHTPQQGADERFDRFWAAYPRKTAKEPARKAFLKIKPDDLLLETMLAAIGTHSLTDQWRRDNGQYIPHAATWLNQRRWEDDAQAEPDECVNWAVNHAY